MVWDDIGKNELGVVNGVGVCFVRDNPITRAEVTTYLRYADSRNPHSTHDFSPEQARAMAALLVLAADLAEQQ